MKAETRVILEHLLIALAAGSLIGFERSFHGRPAGFRTHALVCVASSALMLVTMYQGQWFPSSFSDTVHIDPTRMAQGIMTGIGFYFPLTVTTVLTLGTLSVFRWIEAKMPAQFYAKLEVKFAPDTIMPEDDFRRFVADHGFTIADLNYHYSVEPGFFEYGMVIRTQESANASRLSEALRKTVMVHEFGCHRWVISQERRCSSIFRSPGINLVGNFRGRNQLFRLTFIDVCYLISPLDVYDGPALLCSRFPGMRHQPEEVSCQRLNGCVGGCSGKKFQSS